MVTYAILQDPGHNRVYYTQSQTLCLAELQIATKRFLNPCSKIEPISIANVSYLSFALENELNDHDLAIISRLSFVFGLFQVINHNNNTLLNPIKTYEYSYVDQKISSVLKYPGKTNELFTKMMVNVALLSSRFDYEDNIQLLDPIAGRGTTLYEGIIYGFDAYGIELEAKSAQEVNLFFKKYLERERYKHRSAKRNLSAHDKENASTIYEFEFAKDKELYKHEENRKHLAIIHGNSVDTARYYRPKTIHLIVGDLPYGIAHGNTAQKKQSGITRSPKALLEACLPAWSKTLMPGGSLVLAWNTFVLAKDEVAELLQLHNFEVLQDDVYKQFEHRVDNAIKRDIIVARKK